MTGIQTCVAAANDDPKVEEGFIPFVAFVIFTELTATLLLTLPNWYLST